MRLPMRKIREVLRLKFEHNLSERKISKSCNISRSTVKDYLTRFSVSGLTWPLPDTLDDPSLKQKLFPAKTEEGQRRQPTPDWSKIHEELRHSSVTLMLLWQDYKACHTDGYQYSWFSYQYRLWSKNSK